MKTTWYIPHRDRRKRYLLIRDLSLDFQRHIGRALCFRDRVLIHSLERARRAGIPPRFYVIDPPDHDSRPALVDYLYWRAPSIDDAIIYDRNLAEARRFAPSPKSLCYSGRKPNAVRGRCFSHAIILNADQYDVRQVISPIIGVILMLPETLIVVHSRNGRPPLGPAFRPLEWPPIPFGIYPIPQYDDVNRPLFGTWPVVTRIQLILTLILSLKYCAVYRADSNDGRKEFRISCLSTKAQSPMR